MVASELGHLADIKKKSVRIILSYQVLHCVSEDPDMDFLIQANAVNSMKAL